ncbi:MAG: DUF456 domain-containing protein [Alistipes sp.]|nr:DUF456 domain-containing protein [Alistipes sp.]
MENILSIIAIACGIVGLLGTVLPVLPGTIVSYLGMLLIAFRPDSEISLTMLIIWGVLSVAVIVMDYILPAFLSKRFGGTKAGSTGATIGTILGIFGGPIGIILGPFFGAVIGELLAETLSFNEAIKVGVGSMLSFLVGTFFKLVAGGLMLFYIIKDII